MPYDSSEIRTSLKSNIYDKCLPNIFFLADFLVSGALSSWESSRGG